MKYLVISDIHGNLPALDAVLANGLPGADAVLCLGDAVGYGADPAACVARLGSITAGGVPFFCVQGNHDAAVCGALSTEWFNPVARFAVGFTRNMLAPADVAWLRDLPLQVELPGSCMIVHGSPLDPLTGYLFGDGDTDAALAELDWRGVRLCLVGHTHTSAHFEPGTGATGFRVPPGTRWRPSRFPAIVNPGSVGFPRSRPEEGNPADYPAEYAVWDSDAMEIEFREARYDRSAFEERLQALYESAE